MSASSHQQLLAQLQNEVNLVLEQTGKVFTAAKGNGRPAPLAQVARLQQVLQKSDLRFHEALDRLEQELQLATLVMKRDLALCREASGPGKTTEPSGSKAITANSNQDDISQQRLENSPKPEHTVMEDIIMQDTKPAETQNAPEVANLNDIMAQGHDDAEKHVSDPAKASADPQAQDPAPDASQKPTTASLQLDTQTPLHAGKAEGEQPGDEDRPPDTGTFSNTNDFDSLFGGPLSAGPGDASGFNLDVNNNDEFDFDVFAAGLNHHSADNNNISALLPGLEDYANIQSNDGGETDFHTMFSSAAPLGVDDKAEGDGAGIPHRDSTFDDLGDLLDFNVGEFTGGGDGGGSHENNEFDFSLD